jgi:hypothetical protein
MEGESICYSTGVQNGQNIGAGQQMTEESVNGTCLTTHTCSVLPWPYCLLTRTNQGHSANINPEIWSNITRATTSTPTNAVFTCPSD